MSISTHFLSGPAGTGKTTRAVTRLQTLLADGIPPHHILVLVPQRTLAAVYTRQFETIDKGAGSPIDVLTPDSLTLRTLRLLWPQIAAGAGFAAPDHPPHFLTIETAQYYLDQVLAPLLKRGYFDPNAVSLTLPLPRLMSQLLDNLEKAAMIGLPHETITARLQAAMGGNTDRGVAFEHAQVAMTAFRQFCLQHNLLDFSLRLETFRDHVWMIPDLRQYLTRRYRHLVVDNVEEHNPFTHAMLRDWLADVESAFLVLDDDAGYRIFLGANARTGEALAAACASTERLSESYAASPPVLALGEHLARALIPAAMPDALAAIDPRTAFTFHQTRFHPQMIAWAVEQVAQLLDENSVNPADIVILAPFISDTLRFSLLNALSQRAIAARAHRPSRALKEEPIVVALISLVRLINQHWQGLPPAIDLVQTLVQVIADLDWVRARLLVDVLYRPDDLHHGPLFPYAEMEGSVRDRIGEQVGLRYDQLRTWLLHASQQEPVWLDHLLARLFDEVLARPGFGFHQSVAAGEAVANLMESMRKFRLVAAHVPVAEAALTNQPDIDALNRAYVRLLSQGVVSALYPRSWQTASEDAVMVMPAYTFLMWNRPVKYQIWLDVGSPGWWERIAQPLTHPYVLAADWSDGQTWSDQAEHEAQVDRLRRLVLGLTRRCQTHIFVAGAEISEQGQEQRGRLLIAFQQMLRRLAVADGENDQAL